MIGEAEEWVRDKNEKKKSKNKYYVSHFSIELQLNLAFKTVTPSSVKGTQNFI